jgi:hypothetical protein
MIIDFFQQSDISGSLLFAILMTARLAEEEVTRASLSALELFLPSSTAGVLAAARVWSATPTMEREVGAA